MRKLGNNVIGNRVDDPLTGERKGSVIVPFFPLMLCISIQVFKKQTNKPKNNHI